MNMYIKRDWSKGERKREKETERERERDRQREREKERDWTENNLFSTLSGFVTPANCIQSLKKKASKAPLDVAFFKNLDLVKV